MTFNAKKIIRIFLLGGLFLFVLVFAFFRSKGIIFGVEIKNINITDGKTYQEDALFVSGNAKNAIVLKINGKAVQINPEGDFREPVSLYQGYNIITLEAQDKFGNLDKKNYKIMH